jgi:hypothetical protein
MITFSLYLTQYNFCSYRYIRLKYTELHIILFLPLYGCESYFSYEGEIIMHSSVDRASTFRPLTDCILPHVSARSRNVLITNICPAMLHWGHEVA